MWETRESTRGVVVEGIGEKVKEMGMGVLCTNTSCMLSRTP